MNFKEQSYFMKMALEMANKAYQMDEVPIGAVVVDSFGKIIGQAHNLKERDHDPSAHAEILAIRQACESIENWRLENCTLFVTLEPCPMCLSLMQQCRIKNLIFGAYDKKGGALSNGYNLHNDSNLNHQFSIRGGLNHYICSRILSDFFKKKRAFYK